jgi:proton-translocating NAD(P)+ transhydrogenase subunit alpha
MIAAVPRESFPGEKRVALVPKDVAALAKAGLQLVVERGAGAAALHEDGEYEAQGWRVETDRKRLFTGADLLLTVRGPGSHREFPQADLDALKPGAAIVGFLDPLDDLAMTKALAERGLTLFSMELMPRVTRAQSMDALSSMATISGYKAVLVAANAAPRMFPMLMTAAGTVTAARVFVLGAGVAGLQAIATARRLGGVVEGYDVRPAVKEQVESLGARFVVLDVKTDQAETAGGYAQAQSEEFYRRQQQLLGEHLRGMDVIITTAAVPGKKAPVLITREMVAGLRPGTVIVDLAAERGGNCALTKPGQTVDHHGVWILGPMNLPSEVPAHASQLYSRNLTTFLTHLVKDGTLRLDEEDEIVSGTLVARGGKVVHPMVAQALEGK